LRRQDVDLVAGHAARPGALGDLEQRIALAGDRGAPPRQQAGNAGAHSAARQWASQALHASGEQLRQVVGDVVGGAAERHHARAACPGGR
jgi:hypothetical protein